MPLYIEKVNGDVDQMTDRQTDRVNILLSAFFESLKIEEKKKARDLQFLRNHERMARMG